MIEYRIGARNSGKSYKLDMKLSGQRNLYVHALKYQARKIIESKTEIFYKNDYSRSKSYSINELPSLSDFDNIVIDDLNLFLNSLFPKKNIYVNISPFEHGVELKEITRNEENELL